MSEPIGRAISAVILGNTDREHPIEDAIAGAVHDAGKRFGFDALVASGPYYADGDERDRELVKVSAERDRLRLELQAIAVSQPSPGNRQAEFLVQAAREALAGGEIRG